MNPLMNEGLGELRVSQTLFYIQKVLALLAIGGRCHLYAVFEEF